MSEASKFSLSPRVPKRLFSPKAGKTMPSRTATRPVSLVEATVKNLGGIGAIGFRVTSDADMARAIEGGFSVKAIDALKKTGITDKEIGRLVIKPRTLSHRVQRRQRLTSDESDRAARVARVAALAIKTFANKDKANTWLHKPLSSLDGRRPLDLINTTAGARVIEDVLTRIAWGSAA